MKITQEMLDRSPTWSIDYRSSQPISVASGAIVSWGNNMAFIAYTIIIKPSLN